MTGEFIVIEGPNGVGKSTMSRLLAAHLQVHGVRNVHLTAEPSSSELGRLLRTAEVNLAGRALAFAVAADRYHHLTSEIVPQLEAGCWVVSDRYVQSSLVLQRIDGLELDEIWSYNRFMRPPSVSFYLTDTPGVIHERLAARSSRSRLERTGTPARELLLYEHAFSFLDSHSWRQVSIHCHGRAPDSIVRVLFESFDMPAGGTG